MFRSHTNWYIYSVSSSWNLERENWSIDIFFWTNMNMHYTILSTLNYLAVLIRHHISLKISVSLIKLIWIAHPGSKNEFLHQTKKLKRTFSSHWRKGFFNFWFGWLDHSNSLHNDHFQISFLDQMIKSTRR